MNAKLDVATSTRLAVVCFKWARSATPIYRAEHVNILRAMVERHLSIPHTFVCATEDPNGLDHRIRVVPVERDLVPLGNAFPKLAIFRPDAGEIFGDRILLLDVDVVITASLDPLVNRTEDIVLLRDFNRPPPPAQAVLFNSSILLVTAGAFPEVWERFDPATSVDKIRASRLVGSDQAWITMTLGTDRPTWAPSDGILSGKHLIRRANEKFLPRILSRQRNPLPTGARLLAFHGKQKPWHAEVSSVLPWVRDYWYE
jgi:hypothetical protein